MQLVKLINWSKKPSAVATQSTMKRVQEYLTHSKNIYDTFLPFKMVLKTFGLVPFTFSHHNKKGPSMTFFERFLLGFWVPWYLFLFTMIAIWGQQEPEAEKSLLIKHGWHKLYMFEMFMLACVAVLNFTNKLSIVDCLRLMDQFDLVEVDNMRLLHDFSPVPGKFSSFLF